MFKNILFLLSSEVVSSYAYSLGKESGFLSTLSIILSFVSLITTIALKLLALYVLIKVIQVINIFIKNNNKQKKE